jgi:hypothetical protein
MPVSNSTFPSLPCRHNQAMVRARIFILWVSQRFDNSSIKLGATLPAGRLQLRRGHVVGCSDCVAVPSNVLFLVWYGARLQMVWMVSHHGGPTWTEGRSGCGTHQPG